MKFVFASDSLKGTLSSKRAGELLTRAAREAYPHAECVALAIADGGEGTLDAIGEAREGTRVVFAAHDGLMRPTCGEAFICDGEAFVEAASTCGLAMLAPGERNPLLTSSFGVGECIRQALERGCGAVTVGLGGTCTNDGGMGCLRALGVRFYDGGGCELPGRGADMERVARIDESGMHPLVRDAAFTIMSDVTNPLLGPHGATYVFGPQKGANDEALARLEAGMGHFAELAARAHADVDSSTPGFGAAGGLGMALSVFLGARMRSGIEELLRWIRFDDVVRGADLIVTGEGRLDAQSLQGKVISGIVAHARRLGVPVAAICGTVALGEEDRRGLGLAHVIDASEGQPLEYALVHAEENYRRAARELFAAVAGAQTTLPFAP